MSQIADSKSSLPQSWLSLPIGHVSHVISGGTPPSKDKSCFTTPGNGIPWLTPADLSNNKAQHISHGSRDLTDKGFSLCSAQILPTGSVLFSSRAPIGYVAIAQNPLSTNQGFKSFALPTEIDSRFIYYQLRHLKAVAETLATGTTFKELSGSTAARIPITLAPTNEQRRIADKLDCVLARVDAANEHISRVAPLIKRFRQSVLSAATLGRLTEDWREQNTIKLTDTNNEIDSFRTSQLPELPHSWSWKPFSSVARVSSNLQDPSAHTESIHLAPNHVESWTGRINCVRTIAEDGVTSPKHKFNAGQIVYSKIRPNLCKVAIPKFSGLCSADMYPIDTDIHVHYLAYWMRSQKFTDWASNAESRTVLPKINQAQLNTIPVPVPSSQEEQSEIVRRVEKLFSFADRLEERLSQAQAAVQKLTPALLAKAFRGELVPQDPNDEPASELLKRLQESRANDSKPRRARKPRATSAGESP